MINYILNTTKKRALIFLIALAVIFNTSPMFAQINAFVGYVYSQNRDSKTLNSIIDRYNARNPTLLQPMSTFNFLHGVDLGVRYRFPSVSLELNWINKFNQVNDRVLASDNTEYKNNLYYKSQSYCLGTEFYYQWFGIGASIDWNQVVIKKEKSTDRVKVNWLSEGGLSNHIFMNFEMNMNDAMSLSVRPYVQLPLYKNNFYDVEAHLNPTLVGTIDPESYKQKVVNWGIKFLFVNGEKAR